MLRIVIASLSAVLLMIHGGSAWSSKLAYGGGPIISDVQVVPVYYGQWAPADVAAVQSYLTVLSSYLDGADDSPGQVSFMEQYGIRHASTPYPSTQPLPDGEPRPLSDPDVTSIVHTFQSREHIGYTANRVFVVLAGPRFSDGGSLGCGHHGTEGPGMYWAIVPAGCLDFNAVLSHEVLEAISDPDVASGWRRLDDAVPGRVDEAIDGCDGGFDLGVGTVSAPYDNLMGRCGTGQMDAVVPLIYRYVNSSTQDHFFTGNYNEMNEGVNGYSREVRSGTFSMSGVPGNGRMPVYRFRDTASNHFYTTTQSEGTGAGFTSEGILGYLYASPNSADGATAALHRYSMRNPPFLHHYTTDVSELNGNSAWVDEGVMGYVWPSGGSVASYPFGGIYRYLNSSSGDYVYSSSYGELGEGGGGYSRQVVRGTFSASVIAFDGGLQLQRYVKGNQHFMTTNPAEAATAGYQLEGPIGWIASTSGTAGATRQLYRYVNLTTQGHFYTADLSEKGLPTTGPWRFEAVIGYVWPVGAFTGP